jgi:hypothetical protein
MPEHNELITRKIFQERKRNFPEIGKHFPLGRNENIKITRY